MITSKYVRDNIEAIRKSLQKRKSNYPLDELINLDEKSKKLKTQLQSLQAERNKVSLLVSEKKKKEESVEEEINRMREVKEQIDAIEAEISKYDERLNFLLWNLPNILDDSVPYGKDDSENLEVRKWGQPRNAHMNKDHDDILEALQLLDTKSAAKVSGARFYYLKGDLVLLDMSLLRYAIDSLVKKNYIPISPPYMLRKEFYHGVTALGDFEESLYKVADPKEVATNESLEKVGEDLFLIATSEHTIAAMHSETVFSSANLPLKYVGISPCFRREAGSHGKDTKGIFRTHQFNKVEQFIFATQKDPNKYLEEIVKNAEELWQGLGIPYHIVNICTGDIGTVASKKFDLEVYIPSQDRYREMGSYSNCTDWQSRRLNIKYDEGTERKYVYTFNGTAFASPRALIPIIENYINDDGTITIPEALVPYMGKRVIGK
ncbi:MAG: serine--tRNA ligase [Candidatus Micrarchaeaceae archaeon]